MSVNLEAGIIWKQGAPMGLNLIKSVEFVFIEWFNSESLVLLGMVRSNEECSKLRTISNSIDIHDKI